MRSDIVHEFIPDAAHPRHSEGAFLRLKDGSILFAYSRYNSGFEDDSPSDIVGVRSCDEGENWGPPEVLVEAARYGCRNIMSVSLMRMNSGAVGMFYIAKVSSGVSRIYLAISSDEGRTFCRDIECTASISQGYYVLNNDRVIRLSSGRLLMPLAFHRGSFSTDGGAVTLDSRAVAVFLYSDDDGETWHEAPDTVSMPWPSSHKGLQEPGVIEKANGVVWAYFRTDMMCQYEAFSLDQGLTWTAAQPSRFTSPVSPMKLARCEATGDLYAVWNPIPQYNGRVLAGISYGRTPIVYAVSHDDGATWGPERILADDPEHGYCYPAIFFTRDGHMLLSYCSGGPADVVCQARTSIQKVKV